MIYEDEQRIRQIIQEELSTFKISDRYVFDRTIQIMDGKNIQIAKGVGSKIGTEAAQKIALHGATPVIQASAISSPSADVDSLKTAVDAIRVALTNKGITA